MRIWWKPLLKPEADGGGSAGNADPAAAHTARDTGTAVATEPAPSPEAEKAARTAVAEKTKVLTDRVEAEELGEAEDKAAGDEQQAQAAEAGATEKPAETKPDKPPETVELTAKQREAAKHGGLSDETVEALGDSAPAVLDGLAAAQAKLSKGWADLGKKSQGEPGGKSAADAAAGTDAGSEGEPLALVAPTFDAEEDGYMGEETAKKLTGTFQAYADRIQSLEAALGTVAPMIEDMATERQQGRFNTFFQGKSDWKQLYGEGPMGGLKEGGAEAEARNEVVKKAEVILAGAEATGADISPEDALEMAHRAHAFDAAGKAERDKLKAKVKKRSRQIGPTPSGRRQEPVTIKGQERQAKKDVQAFIDERAMGAEE